MRLLALVSALSMFLTACGGGASSPVVLTPGVALPQLQLTGAIPAVLAFTDSFALGASSSGAILPLFEIPKVPTNQGLLTLAFWGTKDSSGRVLALHQAAITGIGTPSIGRPSGGVHVFFDTSSRPVLLRDDGTGTTLQLSYDSPTQVTMTVCDSQNAIVGAAPILFASGTWQAGVATATGSCVVRNTVSIARPAAAASPAPGIGGGVATNVTDSLADIAKLVTAASYVAGFGLAVAAILKFKAHKDNPTQVAISQPIVLLFLGAALIFLPSVFSTAGGTIFGPSGDVAVDGLPIFQNPSSLPGCASSTPATATCPFSSPNP